MRFYFRICIFVLMLFSCCNTYAQWETKRLSKPFQVDDTNFVSMKKKDSNQVDFHMSMGTEFVTGGGYTSSLFWISPQITYRISPKFTLITGFTYGADLFGNTKTFSSNLDVDLAPRERRNNYSNIYARGEYQANDKLRFAATVFYENGAPFVFPCSPIDNIETIGFAAEMQYKIKESTLLSISVSFQRSNYSINDYFYTPYTNTYGMGDQNRGFGYVPSMFNHFR